MSQVRSNRFGFLFGYYKIAFLLLFLVFLGRALWRSLIINGISVKRFFSMMIFIIFGFSLFFIELRFPLFVNQLMIISKISQRLFKFAFKNFITKLIFFHVHHVVNLVF